MKILFIDTETSDLYHPGDEHKSRLEQPWIVQIAMILADANQIYHAACLMINALDRHISPHAQKVHGISREMTACGVSEMSVAMLSGHLLSHASLVVGHNVEFDLNMLSLLYLRQQAEAVAEKLRDIPIFCTMKSSTNYCALPGRYGKPKWPKLHELHEKLFSQPFEGAHDALTDAICVRRCFFEMLSLGLVQ